MKILYILGLFPTLHIPIKGVFIKKRLEQLQIRNIGFDIVCPYFVEQGLELLVRKIFNKTTSIYDRETINGFTYNYVPVKISFCDKFLNPEIAGKKMAAAILNKINISEYDLIHTQWVYPQGYAASIIKKKCNIPIVITSQGSDIHTIPFKKPFIKKPIVKALSKADKIIFVSNYLLKKAREIGYSSNNYEIITNGADLKKFFYIDKNIARNKLELPLDNKIVGFVGNLNYVKRVDKLPIIFKKISELNKNVLFVIIGTGTLQKFLKNQCAKYNINTVFTDKIEHNEVPLWMNSFDVLILPSRKEGFPNVVIEAQACGCPVVGSDCGGIPEAIFDGCGKLVPDNNAFEINFAKSVIDLLNNMPDKNEMIEKAKEYDWKNIVEQEIKVYYNIL